MKKINLYGGPGIGKSTVTALVFAALKVKGFNAEMINEYAKELVYEGIDLTKASKHLQNKILIEQIKRELLFEDKVDYLITDSPIMLNAYYNKDPKALEMAKLHQSTNDIHFFLQRGFENFETKGRSHNKKESLEIDDKMTNFLIKNKIDLKMISGDSQEKADQILKLLGIS